MNEEQFKTFIDKTDTTNALLQAILEQLQEDRPTKKSNGGRRSTKNVDPQLLADMEGEVNIEQWFETYGEEVLPAKYMNMSGSGIPFTKEEMDCLFALLQEYEHESLKDGTHTWQYLGKVWCPREKNARNCFACVPIKKGVFLNESNPLVS